MNYVKILGRGWMSESDNGSNSSYYLYINFYCRFISPYYFVKSFYANVMDLNFHGGLGGNWVNIKDGGVHIHELCCIFINFEAGILI